MPISVVVTDRDDNYITEVIRTYNNSKKQILTSELRKYNSTGQCTSTYENYEYDSGDYGDLIGYWGPGTTWTTGTTPDNDNYKITRTYDPTYHFITQSEYRQDANTIIKTTFIPDSTGKSIEYVNTYENVNSSGYVLKDKTQYIHDQYGNVTEQRNYLEGSGSTWSSYISTFFVYDDNVTARNGQFDGGYLTRIYSTGVKDADGTDIAARSGLSAGTVDTRYEYDIVGNMVKSYDAKGNLTQFQYDDLGRLTQTINPDTTTISISYDDENNETTVTDENNNSFKRVYDAFGNHLRDIDILSSEILSETEYDDMMRVIRESSNDDNSIIEYTYQEDGRLSMMEVYNKYGKLESKETYEYDDAVEFSSIYI